MEGSESAGMSAGVSAGQGVGAGPGGDLGVESSSMTASFEAESVTAADSFEGEVVFEGRNVEEFASSPVSAHDKLVALAEMPEDEFVLPESEQISEELELDPSAVVEKKEDQTLPEPETDEQKLLRLQQETMELLAKRLGGSENKETDQQVKELLQQLKYLLESLSSEKQKGSLTASVFALILMFLESSARAEQKFENEVKQVQA